MRLLSLHLTRYGHFADERIAFDPRPGTVNLLYAPNGAGKSILRQAFVDLLFGIAGQSEMGFRFRYTGMRIMAEALDTDGAHLVFGRRKGHGNTLLDGDGNPAEPGRLARLLGHADRPLLERLFALDTERLRDGGKALLESGGAVADALLSGGGLRGARDLRQALEASSDALAPAKRSAQRPFYRALEALKDARARANAALLRPDDWARMEQELADALAHQQAQNSAAAAQAKRMAQLERLRRVRAPLAARDVAVAWLEAHPDAPVLAASLETKLADAAKKLTIAVVQAEQAHARRAEYISERDNIIVDATTLAVAEAIERLSEHAGAVSKALQDIPQRQAELDAVLLRLAALLRHLNSDLAPEAAATLIPHRAAESRARALIGQYSAVAAAAEQAPLAAAAAAQKLAAAIAEQAALPPVEDSQALVALVAEIRAGGDPTMRAEESARAEAECCTALSAALAATPGWTRCAESLAAMVLPAPASFERLDAARRAAEAALGAMRQRAQEEAERQKQAERRLAAVTAGETLADPSAVAEARRRRDRGWQLIYRLAFTEAPPPLAEQAAFCGEMPLPLAYQSTVQQADDLADRRVLQSDLIAQTNEAQRALSEAKLAAEAAASALIPAAQGAAEASSAWAAACAALPLGATNGAATHGAALGIEEVRAFLIARERVVERLAAVTRETQARARLVERQEAWAARLGAALGADTHSLAGLLSEAELRVASAAKVAGQHIALEASLRELRRQEEAAAAIAMEAGHRHETWQTAWADILEQLGRPAGEHPGVTADILALLGDLDQELRTAAQLEQRLAAMRDDNQAFGQQVWALLAQAAPDLAGALNTQDDVLGCLAGLRTLRERLQEQRARATRRAELQKFVEQADRHVATMQHRLTQAKAERDALLSVIGAATIEAAEQRLEAARDRAQHVLARDQAEARLIAEGDGMTLAELRAELAELAADDVAGELETAQTAMNAAHLAAQEAASLASRHKLQMEQRAGDVGYEAAAADQQAAFATIDRVLEEALLARLAALLLERAMAAVEGKSGSGLLGRIGDYFCTLTGGAYRGIVTEETEDGRLALAMVPANVPHEQKSVAALSEGTRDQLYLALRLAAIEDHVANAPPLPFIGDDILQTSDDSRAIASLHALRDVSHHVQVILLSHHQHVVELARALPAGCVHVCELAPLT